MQKGPAMRIRKDSDILEKEEIQRRTVCNKDLCAAFDYAQATISQHVKKLVSSGLLEVQKKENFNYYFVNIGMLGRYLNAVKKLNQ